MNERLKELENQAVYYNEDEQCWDFDRKKFAELIVKECALTAGLMEQANRPNIGAGILDSFGVAP